VEYIVHTELREWTGGGEVVTVATAAPSVTFPKGEECLCSVADAALIVQLSWRRGDFDSEAFTDRSGRTVEYTRARWHVVVGVEKLRGVKPYVFPSECDHLGFLPCSHCCDCVECGEIRETETKEE
jgi:hypothetical protein